MKRFWRIPIAMLVLAVIVAAGSALYAQQGGDEAAPSDTADKSSGDKADDPDVTIPGEKQAKLTSREMLQKSEERINEMKQMLTRVLEVQKVARKQKDVIRLNCVNDRLLQVKKLLNIAESSRNDLVEAISAENERDRYHQYSKVTISYENVSVLRDEAEACVGEELIFLGPTEVVVDAPDIIDDPTADDPFAIGAQVERPSFATATQ